MPQFQGLPRLGDATKEWISFGPFLSDLVRRTNRPAFQPVISFRSHR